MMRQKLGCSGLLVVLQLVAAGSAAAAELEEVQGFGDNPSGTRMFVYVPERLAAQPPILVAIHYCTGSAQAFFTGTSYRSQADRHGFVVIYPETTASDRCFDVHSAETLTHDGGGESMAIANMVRYALREYSANAQRVYVTGTSSGAMMTNVMLGAYPELFRAGAAFAGVPFGCFAGPDRWHGDCASGKVTKTAQQWGDLVRAAYPGFSGPRPRMQLWHGDQDETLSFHNFGEEIKQWTHVLGVSETPTSTEQGAPDAGWTRTRYADSAGVVRVEAMAGPGMPHNLKVLTDEAVRFFGLDTDRDPVPAAGGGGSSGSAGGAAGVAGAAGALRAGASGQVSVPMAGMSGAAAVQPAAGSGAGGRVGSASAGSAAMRMAAVSAAAGRVAPVAAGHAAGGGMSSAAQVMAGSGEVAQPVAMPAAGGCSVARNLGRGSNSFGWLMLTLICLCRVARRIVVRV